MKGSTHFFCFLFQMQELGLLKNFHTLMQEIVMKANFSLFICFPFAVILSRMWRQCHYGGFEIWPSCPTKSPDLY